MRISAVDVRHNEASQFPSLGLDRATRDGLAAYARLRWPTGTAKALAREFDLSLDEAKGVVSARASQATVDRIWKHPNGGWAVILPVLGSVVGHGVDAFIQQERKRHAENARRSGALVRDLRAVRVLPARLPDHVADGSHPRRRTGDR